MKLFDLGAVEFSFNRNPPMPIKYFRRRYCPKQAENIAAVIEGEKIAQEE